MRILRVTMLLANRLLGATIPAAARNSILGKIRASLALVEEIQAEHLMGQEYNTESLAYFRLMMRLRERQSDRLRFLQRLALTPGPGEWKAVRLAAAAVSAVSGGPALSAGGAGWCGL